MHDPPRILVIDDEPEIVRSLCVRLGAAGYDALSAPDGYAGLDSAIRDRPDAILLDIRMAGMDGIEVLKRLKGNELTAGIPVAVLSANVIENTRAEALGLGARCFIPKPFRAEKVMAAIGDMIGLAPAGAAVLPGT